MKGKCKKCGKHFDLDVYSGLCPKCGTYNGQHAEETDVSRYISGGYQGEEAHRQLHVRYGDTGHQTKRADPAPILPQGKRQDGQVSKSKIPLYPLVMVLLLILVPLCSEAVYKNWEKQYTKQLLEKEVAILQESAEGFLLFDREPLESSVRFEVLGAKVLRMEELDGGEMALAVVKARVSGEGYNFDARINQVALEYTYEGEHFYREMLSSYDLDEYMDKTGLTKQDLFSLYSIGNDGEQEGYFVFAIHAKAENPRLYLSVGSGQGAQVVFLEGTILLDSFWNADAGEVGEMP